MEKLCAALAAYKPFNPQEAADRELLMKAIRTEENILTRENRLCHLTASAWVTNASRTRVLMAYHNLYKSWSWLGGHADGNPDLLAVAMKEVREESGITRIKPLSRDIFSLESLVVEGHEKRGEYVPCHLHLNVTYLLEADEAESLHICPGENSGVSWFSLQEAVEASCEPWFRERIYSKLNQKLLAWTAAEK